MRVKGSNAGYFVEAQKGYVLIFVAVCCLLCHGHVSAATGGAARLRRQRQTPHQHPHSTEPPRPVEARPGPVKMSVPDSALRDQDGKPVRFYSDLIRGKSVAINFVYTSCAYTCPPLADRFAKLQQLLGGRLGKDFHLISVSVDPLTDTPERLKAWGAKFGARPGWTFVTGEKAEVDRLLRALTGDPSGREYHSVAVLVGGGARGEWVRAYGLAQPARLRALLESVDAQPAPR